MPNSRLIPIMGALTSLRSAARVPRPMGIAAMPSSPLTRRRVVTLSRGRILRPAAATRRHLVHTLHRLLPTLPRVAATATAAGEVTAEEVAITVAAASVAVAVPMAAASAALAALMVAAVASAVVAALTAVAADPMVAVEVTLTKKSLNF